MKPVPECPNEERLLDAVFADGHWHEFKAQLHTQALGTLADTRKKRQQRSRFLQGTLAAVLLVALASALTYSALLRPVTVVAPTTASPSSPGQAVSPYISEAEMLALFPKGSCVVAEIDGQKEVVFLDVQAAADGFAPDRVAQMTH